MRNDPQITQIVTDFKMRELLVKSACQNPRPGTSGRGQGEGPVRFADVLLGVQTQPYIAGYQRIAVS